MAGKKLVIAGDNLNKKIDAFNKTGNDQEVVLRDIIAGIIAQAIEHRNCAPAARLLNGLSTIYDRVAIKNAITKHAPVTVAVNPDNGNEVVSSFSKSKEAKMIEDGSLEAFKADPEVYLADLAEDFFIATEKEDKGFMEFDLLKKAESILKQAKKAANEAGRPVKNMHLLEALEALVHKGNDKFVDGGKAKGREAVALN